MRRYLHLFKENIFEAFFTESSFYGNLLHIEERFFIALLLFLLPLSLLGYVESYLERIFYNLTTVALHNWRTYGEMRALAAHKFGANTVEDNLPAQTLEQVLNYS